VIAHAKSGPEDALGCVSQSAVSKAVHVANWNTWTSPHQDAGSQGELSVTCRCGC